MKTLSGKFYGRHKVGDVAEDDGGLITVRIRRDEALFVATHVHSRVQYFDWHVQRIKCSRFTGVGQMRHCLSVWCFGCVVGKWSWMAHGCRLPIAEERQRILGAKSPEWGFQNLISFQAMCFADMIRAAAGFDPGTQPGVVADYAEERGLEATAWFLRVHAERCRERELVVAGLR